MSIIFHARFYQLQIDNKWYKIWVDVTLLWSSVALFEKKAIRTMLFIFVVTLLFVIVLKYNWNRRKLYQTSWSMTGPPALPIVGNALMFLNTSSIFFGYRQITLYLFLLTNCRKCWDYNTPVCNLQLTVSPVAGTSFLCRLSRSWTSWANLEFTTYNWQGRYVQIYQ